MSKFLDEESYICTIDWINRLNREMPLLEELILEYKDKKESRILDLGCGPGKHLQEIAKLYPKIKLIGIDIDEAMINYAKAEASKENLNIEYRCGNFLKDPEIINSYFDLIFSIGNSLLLIWGTCTPMEVLEILYKHLNPNGKLFFQILNGDNPREGYFPSKIRNTAQNEETFILKRFDPDISSRKMYIEFLTFKRKPKDSVYDFKITKSHWPIINLEEMTQLLKDAGFRDINYWGTYRKDNYNPKKSKDLICLAKK